MNSLTYESAFRESCTLKLEIYTETVTGHPSTHRLRRKTQNKERPPVVQYYSSQQLQFSIEKAARSGIETGQRREKMKSKILLLGKIFEKSIGMQQNKLPEADREVHSRDKTNSKTQNSKTLTWLNAALEVCTIN
jgi:hypothetical protein